MFTPVCRWLLPVVLMIFVSCGGEKQGDKKDQPKDSTEAKQPEKQQPLPYDTLLTETAYFIAGLPAPVYLDSLQAKEYYAEHKKFTDTSWKFTVSSMLDPIAKWKSEKQIGETGDSMLCFYPLSGPDFLFGHAFFPKAKNYILLGLEPRGSMCDFRNMNDDQLKKYLSGIRGSMKYLNSRGYFVTMHMSSDFTKAHLNGMVHMMLYMMARTGHFITDVYNVSLNADGTEKRLEKNDKMKDTVIYAIKIDFLPPDRLTKKSAYYFKLDAADENLDKHTEFEKFVNDFGPRVSYMKSASCVLTNANFAVMRKLVLGSEAFLQDDTGVPYRYILADSTHEINLYGTYTGTINDLDWCYQPGLRKALETKGDTTELPFKISYNGNYGEGMMIWCKKKK